MRAVIRAKAKQQLITQAQEPLFIAIDECLFRELAATLFQAGHCQAIYQPCATKADATTVEDEVALELATIYQNITQQQQDPLVQSLNALL